MRTALATLFMTLLPAMALAVDPLEEDTPPSPTPTSTVCPDGTAWDAATRRCLDIKAAAFDDDDRYAAARELAYAERYQAAQMALDAMSDHTSSRVLTYRGFIARKSGDWQSAERHYTTALTNDPNNHLARSYFAMGLVRLGDLASAQAHLEEIRARGGLGTWPEQALADALQNGWSADY